MAIITQKPAELDILAVAGTPFTLTVNVTATDSNDNPVPWTDFTNPSVVIAGVTGAGPTQSIPTVTVPSDNVVQVVWSGAQTSILLNGQYTWALQIDVDASGPFSLVAGNLQMGNPTTPGVATSATADITVLVGTATANLDLTLDGGGGGGSITEIESTDASVTVTNGTGPIVNLSVTGSIAGVASFNSRTGAVAPTSGDYTVSQVTGAAPLASPALTGTPTAPTKTPGTNNTDVATTAYTDLAVGVETTRATAAEALLAPKASPALTGTPTTPTATVGTNTTQIASTAFVIANAGGGGAHVSTVFVAPEPLPPRLVTTRSVRSPELLPWHPRRSPACPWRQRQPAERTPHRLPLRPSWRLRFPVAVAEALPPFLSSALTVLLARSLMRQVLQPSRYRPPLPGCSRATVRPYLPPPRAPTT